MDDKPSWIDFIDYKFLTKVVFGMILLTIIFTVVAFWLFYLVGVEPRWIYAGWISFAVGEISLAAIIRREKIKAETLSKTRGSGDFATTASK